MHPPDDVRVVHKMGRFLREHGLRVSWVGPGKASDAPANHYGIEYHFYPPRQSRLGRLLSHRHRATRTALGIDRADVYVGVEPDSAAAAVALAHRRKARSVFDIHEAYDDEMLSRWATGSTKIVLSWGVRKALRRICQKVDLVMGVNEMVLAPYAGVSTPRMVLRNCAHRSFADVPVADVCGADRPWFTVMHGKSTIEHGTSAVLSAIEIVKKQAPQCRVVVFDYLGQGSHTLSRQQFDEFIAGAGIAQNVELRKPIPMADMPAVLRNCDVGLIAYARTFGVKSLPNKLFEYMAAGLPIIAPTYSEEIAPILQSERCGLLADMENPQSIASAILVLLRDPVRARDMGRRAREAFLSRHNYTVEAVPFLECVKGWSR
jgi:glycosyltransferase involved in cell wall biosynthesis